MITKKAITPSTNKGQGDGSRRAGFLWTKNPNAAALKSSVGQGLNMPRQSCNKKTIKPFNPSHNANNNKGRKLDGLMFLHARRDAIHGV